MVRLQLRDSSYTLLNQINFNSISEEDDGTPFTRLYWSRDGVEETIDLLYETELLLFDAIRGLGSI